MNLKKQIQAIVETKSAPKGFHFTKDGKLKRGDADQDGSGGSMLRSDPLDKQRSKVPPVSEQQVDEATPTSQQVKQAIGIARDKRYAQGNVTGAVRAMDKLNKGLAQHPAVKKELQKQNENVDQIDELKKSTLASYAKKATSDARFKQGIGKDAEALAKRKRDPVFKSTLNKMGLEYRMKAKSREAGVHKAIDRLAKEEVELDEAVQVKKQNYSWGKMITVHHGSETSYPLHPEHQAKIKSLKPGEKTSFTDETNKTVHAERMGDTVHLSSKGTSKKTPVAHSHFTEQTNSFAFLRAHIQEKTLTPAEKKKREEVAQAIERDNPDMPMAMKMAIATKTAKRVAEEQIDELRTSTLLRYHTKAGKSGLQAGIEASKKQDMGDYTGAAPFQKKRDQRMMGQARAMSKIQSRYATTNEETDDEGKMAKGQLMRMVNQASALAQMMDDDKQLDGWVQSKLTMASDYLDSVHDYLMHNKQDVDEPEDDMEDENGR